MQDSKDPLRPRQGKSTKAKPKHKPQTEQSLELEQIYCIPRTPRMVPDGVYSEQDICHNMQISPNKMREWRTRRMNPLRPLPLDAKQFYYLGATVIAFWVSLGKGE